MKKVLRVLLTIAILILAFALYRSISTPIEFRKEKSKRYNATIEKLKDIRTAQLAYKSEYGKFTGGFDTLINFLKTDSFRVVKAIGFVPDSLTEAQALATNLVSRDTIKISVKDSLFKRRYNIDRLPYVPYTDNKKFKMAAGVIETASGVDVQVFEAKVHNNILLRGLNDQLVINLNDEAEKLEQYPGLKVGDLDEPTNNAGNWE